MNTTDNTDQTEHPQPTVGELMTEGERMALRMLVEGTVTSPSVSRQGTIDSIFDAISNPGRRYVLTYLLCAEDYVTMSELVDYVMARTDASASDEAFRKKVTVSLSHTHLPRLDEEGFIKYNMERQLIMPTDKTALVDPYLKLALIQQQQLTEALES